MNDISIEYVVPDHPYKSVDKKLNVLENMSAECGALLAKVHIRQSRISSARVSSSAAMSFKELISVH